MSDQPEKSQAEIEFEMQFEQVISTEEGRTVLWWVMQIADTFATNLLRADQGRDMIEGRRSVGLSIFHKLTPEVFLLMQREATMRDSKDDRTDKPDSDPFHLLD